MTKEKNLLFDRREFLKSLGIIGGTAMVSCNRMAPEEKLSAYLNPPAEMIPGVAAYYATVCRACPAGCGILVKTREGRPIKLEGNPVHPVNLGKLCARGQGFIQGLYSQQRATTPLVRKKGGLVSTSWEEALDLVVMKTRQAKTFGLLTGLENGSFDDLVRDFTVGFGQGNHLRFEPGVPTAMQRAAELVFGLREIPRYDLSGVNHIVSLGADLLDTWVSPVEFSRQWAEGHGVAGGRTMQMDYIGPRRDLTAIAADRWYTAPMDAMGRIALALLHLLYEKKNRLLSSSDAARMQKMIAALGPKPQLESLTPVDLPGIVERLIRAKRGLVLVGGVAAAGPHATAIHVISLLSNVLLGAIGSAVRFGAAHALCKVNSAKEVTELLDRRAAGDLELLYIHGTNPVYTLPQSDMARKKEGGAGFTVVMTSELDETAEVADVILPVHHPLESWGDYAIATHIEGLMQPVRTPLHRTRHVGDVLLEIAAKAGREMKRKTYKDYLVKRWAAMPRTAESQAGLLTVSDAGIVEQVDGGVGLHPADLSATANSMAFEQMLVAGGRFSTPPEKGATELRLVGNASVPAIKGEVSAKPGYDFIVPFSVELYDGRATHLGWLREVPDPITQTAWEIPVEVAPDVAKDNDLHDGDVVQLKNVGRSITARVLVESGLQAGTIALRPGGGGSGSRESEHTSNPWKLIGRVFEEVSGDAVRCSTNVLIEKITHDELVSVMGSPDSEGRLLHLSLGLDDYRRKLFPILTRHGEVLPSENGHGGKKPVPLPMPHEEKGGTRPADNMYSLQEHTHHRWGMVVDLDKCTGCSACAVACYAENNIPVVGRLEVSRGRELSWIRIEKHVFGQGADERVRFLPVMCQQCDNAPCETVCPVFAASHTTDGLNAQIYNRCIGTRYCSNNCPYKVRRFNYFDYEREKPANQQLNPDVTVRSRGVMEKCTFCIQRIREVQNKHKAAGTPLRDGEIQPACVQTCPTGALVFGDFKNQEWTMSTMARDPRGYRLLDYITNTRPGVVYLRKVDTVATNKG